MESSSILVHMEPIVIQMMAAYVYLAIFKDIIVNRMKFEKYRCTGTD